MGVSTSAVSWLKLRAPSSAVGFAFLGYGFALANIQMPMLARSPSRTRFASLGNRHQQSHLMQWRLRETIFEVEGLGIGRYGMTQ